MTTSNSEVCDVCSHELAAHDRIADRYCAATRTNAMTRGCICSKASIPAASFTHATG
jgi:hypothetical protein